MYFVLMGTVETVYKTNFFFYLLGKKSNFLYVHILPLAYWWVRRNWKEKELWVAILFFPYAIIFSISGWLIQGSKKGYDRISGHLYFLECQYFLYVFETSSVNSVMERTHLPCARFESPSTPIQHVSTGILCAGGVTHTNCKWVMWEGRHAYGTWLLHSCSCSIVPLFHWLLKHRIKDKIMKNFNTGVVGTEICTVQRHSTHTLEANSSS